jgi:hypothetical protein
LTPRRVRGGFVAIPKKRGNVDSVSFERFSGPFFEKLADVGGVMPEIAVDRSHRASVTSVGTC